MAADITQNPTDGVYAKLFCLAALLVIIGLGSFVGWAAEQATAPRNCVEVHHFTLLDGRPATLTIGGTQ